MFRRIKKWLIGGIVILLLIVIGTSVYKRMNTTSISTLSAKVEEIRQAVKLSALDITTEEIFRDTINNKGVVSRVKVEVHISFDIEDIPMTEQGDTLFVQLPREIIEVYESSDNGYQVLDVWSVWFPENFADVTLTSDEENRVKRRLRQKIEREMYTKGYVKRARENAVNSLAALFSRFRDHIVIVDYYPDGWENEKLPPPKEGTRAGKRTGW